MPHFLRIDGRVLHFEHRTGDRGKGAIVFANSLGTDLRVWDAVVERLPKEIPLLRLDKRGHGLSEGGPVTIPDLAEDMARLMDHFGMKQSVVCGVSVGGMIAQALAARRPDLVRAAVLTNTGMAIGTEANWNARIDAVQAGGIEPIADTILDRWFAPDFASSEPEIVAGYRAMLTRTPADGYARVCEAIRDTDLTGQAAKIIQPTICIAGSDDLSTPPDTVRALSEALPDSQLRLLHGVGHLPCIEAPQAVVEALRDIGAMA